MEALAILSAFGLSASAGLNAYIPLLVISLIAKFTNLIHLKQPWDGLTSWWIIGLLVILCIVEFFADSSPVINHVNDIIQTVIRPSAGAIAFAAGSGVFGEVHPVLALGCGLFIAGGVHAVKSAVIRPAVTATTAGTANLPVSMAEDATSTVVSVLSLVVPMFVAAVILLITAWLIQKLWIRIKTSESGVH